MKQKLNTKTQKNMLRNIKWIVKYPEESNEIIVAGCLAILVLPIVCGYALVLTLKNLITDVKELKNLLDS